MEVKYPYSVGASEGGGIIIVDDDSAEIGHFCTVLIDNNDATIFRCTNIIGILYTHFFVVLSVNLH
jgi:hypothetical protein